jgi:hypothetical protein
MSRDSSVGIANRYGLDGPGIESRWGVDIFRTRPDQPWSPTNFLYHGYSVSRGVKRPECGTDLELYLDSSSGPSWTFLQALHLSHNPRPFAAFGTCCFCKARNCYTPPKLCAGGQPFVYCPQLLIQYTCSSPLFMKHDPPSAT